MQSLSRKVRNVWGLEVHEEVSEHRRMGDETALSNGQFSVAGVLSDGLIVFTSTSSLTHHGLCKRLD